MLSINCSCWNFLSFLLLFVLASGYLNLFPFKVASRSGEGMLPWRPEEFFLFAIQTSLSLPKEFLFHREDDFLLNSSYLNTIRKALSQIPALNHSSTIEIGLILLGIWNCRENPILFYTWLFRSLWQLLD